MSINRARARRRRKRYKLRRKERMKVAAYESNLRMDAADPAWSNLRAFVQQMEKAYFVRVAAPAFPITQLKELLQDGPVR